MKVEEGDEFDDSEAHEEMDMMITVTENLDDPLVYFTFSNPTNHKHYFLSIFLNNLPHLNTNLPGKQTCKSLTNISDFCYCQF